MFFWAGTDHCYHGIKTAHTSVHRTSVQISLNRFSRGIARKALPRLGGAVVWCYWWSRDLYKRVRKRAIVRNRESANEHAPQTGEGMPPMSQVASASPSWNKSSSLYPLTPLDKTSIMMFFSFLRIHWHQFKQRCNILVSLFCRRSRLPLFQAG